MNHLCEEMVAALSDLALPEGLSLTALPSVRGVRIDAPSAASKRRWHASLAIVVQGLKEIGLGENVFRVGPGQFTATLVELPVTSRVTKVSAEKPLLAILVDLDPIVLAEVAAKMKRVPGTAAPGAMKAISNGKASAPMLEVATRLVRALKDPEEAAVVGPLLVRQLYFYLLREPDGAAILQFARSGSQNHKISRAIFRHRSELAENVDVLALDGG